jgi:hypothetical protein
VRILAVLVYTVFLRPRNLIYVRDIDYGDPRRAWINGVLIQKLHVVWDMALALELAGLLTLMAAII